MAFYTHEIISSSWKGSEIRHGCVVIFNENRALAIDIRLIPVVPFISFKSKFYFTRFKKCELHLKILIICCMISPSRFSTNYVFPIVSAL